MRIALIGYGKMGRSIEQQALLRGHVIARKVSRSEPSAWEGLSPEVADVAIEFTQPEAAAGNIRRLISAGLPVVTGTTGWMGELPELEAIVASTGGALLHSSNYSPGMNILFQLNEKLAQLMNAFPAYDVLIHERHHRHKKDAPGGSARHLADQVMKHYPAKTRWVNAALENRPPAADEISLSWVRAGEIPGQHEVTWTSAVDRISLVHEAFSREGFALGAVLAAEWLPGKQGVFTFQDVLNA